MLTLAPAPESSKRGALHSHFNLYLNRIRRPISSFHVKKIYSLTSNHDSNRPNLLILLGFTVSTKPITIQNKIFYYFVRRFAN